MANQINITVILLLLAVSSQCQELVATEEGGRYGFFVKKKMVLDFQYDTIDQQFNGNYAVRKDGKWGLVSTDGTESIPCKYDFLYAATSRLYMASHEGLMGVVDSKGSVVLDFLYDKIDHVEEDTQALVRYQGKWCIYDHGTFDHDPEHFIFNTPEIKPMFPGCQQFTAPDAEKKDCAETKMRQSIYQNIKYPAKARENGIQGQVLVRFVVTRQGEVENPVIVSGIGGGCDEEVLRVVNEMPNWIPATQDGINVAAKYTMPVKFMLGNIRG
ncbi:MAG: TonB family protein [Saprospiraceae bacterium]|nr:TonB family protein [Candidatus Opimibacter iunctus]